MTVSRVLVLSDNRVLSEELRDYLPDECQIESVATPLELSNILEDGDVALVLLDLSGKAASKGIAQLQGKFDKVPVVAVSPGQLSTSVMNSLLSLPVFSLIAYPFEPDAAYRITEALAQTSNHGYRQQLRQNLNEINRRLNQRLQELNVIYTVGRFVASSLDLDEVLARIVEASINLTQAEEGFILLKEGEKLYLRIAKNMNEELAQRFYLEAVDGIAWQVIRSGRPTMLHRQTKIATGYLVRSLLYVPLHTPGRGNIGILGVVNLLKDVPFSENHLFTLSSLADFAAIALENARLFTAVEADRSRLSSILEHATEAILVTDVENNLLLWSKTAADAFSIDLKAHGKSIQQAVQHTNIQELFEQKSEDGEALHAEVTADDGRVFNVQLSTIGEVGRVAIMQDITHLKELDRLKSEFVSTVSHDLRTPLTTVQGYVELLGRVGPLTELQESFIQKAVGSLHHITEMISDLLDIGRIEAGYDLEMKPCRIDQVIKQIVDEYGVHAERQRLTLSYELLGEPLWVLGNTGRLRQVLQNLVSNALKYNRPGGWVKISGDKDGKHIVVKVQDNGIGIPLEEQPKVFDRFYRVQSAETEDIRGTGLGLAIVKSVVEKHRGRIWVESKLDEGSVFTFLIPVYEKT